MTSRKQALAEFRERRVDAGVFRVRNTVGGQVFLDAALDMGARWNRHRFQLDFGNHPNPGLQADWNTLGAPAFVFEVVAVLDKKEGENPRDTAENLGALYELWLGELQPFGDRGYHHRS